MYVLQCSHKFYIAAYSLLCITGGKLFAYAKAVNFNSQAKLWVNSTRAWIMNAIVEGVLLHGYDVQRSFGVFGLRLISLDVPTSVIQGNAIWLNCTLDLETDELYSVKWYKNDVEFYRFLPRDSPSAQKYDLPGVFVDLDKSKQGSIFMYKTDLYTEGLYRCEASAESPTFQTVEKEKKLFVYALPQEGPTIHGTQPRYEVGNSVNFTCRSGPSKPAAALKWFINGKPAPPEFEIPYPTIDHPNGLQTSSLGLSFTVNDVHFLQGDAITLGCTAIISETHSTFSEEFIIGDTITEPPSISTSNENGPAITGAQTRYSAGDLLNVNCSSSESNPAPELNWYLNDEKVESNNVIRYPKFTTPDGTQTSSLGLRFIVKPQHFDNKNEIRLKCTATHSRVINMRSDEKQLGGNSRSSGLHVPANVGRVVSRNGCPSSRYYGFSAFPIFLLSVKVLT